MLFILTTLKRSTWGESSLIQELLITLFFLAVCWLTYLQLFSRDPGYIEPWDRSESFHPTLLEYRMNKKHVAVDLLDLSKLLDTLRPPPKIRKINFDVSGFSDNGKFDSFAKKYTEESSLSAHTDFDMGSLIYR